MKTKTLPATKLFAAIGLMSITGLSAAAQPEYPEWVVPATAAAIPNHTASDAASISRGKELYQIGLPRLSWQPWTWGWSGGGRVGRSPGVLSDSKMMWHHTDGAIFRKISERRSPMPAFKEAFAEKQRWDLVNYVRTLAPKPKEGVSVAPPVQVPAVAPTDVAVHHMRLIGEPDCGRLARDPVFPQSRELTAMDFEPVATGSRGTRELFGV